MHRARRVETTRPTNSPLACISHALPWRSWQRAPVRCPPSSSTAGKIQEMKFYAAEAEISTLEAVLTQPWSEDVLSATVAVAWYLRQRDSARALRLVDGVIPLLVPPPEGSRRPDAHRVRGALAACEASALLCDFDVAERWLEEARQHLDTRVDPQAEGDAWLVEAVVAKMR